MSHTRTHTTKIIIKSTCQSSISYKNRKFAKIYGKSRRLVNKQHTVRIRSFQPSTCIITHMSALLLAAHKKEKKKHINIHTHNNTQSFIIQ